jgi:hypothetical protein
MGAPQKNLSNKKMKILSEDINKVINRCYNRFFSHKAVASASKLASPKLSNLLLRLCDFATIIEADCSMKAGDIGRLLNIWHRWFVMAQEIKGLNHYSIHLPCTIVFITKALSPGMQHVIQHSILMSPSGCANHFLGRDLFLEVKN